MKGQAKVGKMRGDARGDRAVMHPVGAAEMQRARLARPVQQARQGGGKNIVFPLDLSAESKQKVKWAIHLGKSYKSTIHVLTYKVGDEFLNNKLMANLKQIQTLLDENGISHTETVLENDKDFARKTQEFAETQLADLIMIMTQQEDKGIREYIIETYAQQIVNDTGNIPVFCVNPNYDGFKSEFVI